MEGNARFDIPNHVIARLLGVGELPETVRSIVCDTIRGRLEKEFRMGRNRSFGWSDITDVGVGLSGDQTPIVYLAVFNGKLVRFSLSPNLILLEGSRPNCRNMEKKIYRWLDDLSRAALLRDIRPYLDGQDLKAAQEWAARRQAKKSKRAGKTGGA
jgi:hypothetical protein